MPMARSGSGADDAGAFAERLQRIEAVVQNQDNREHDLLDSDDYYQFEGGMTAAVERRSTARGRASTTTTIRGPSGR